MVKLIKNYTEKDFLNLLLIFQTHIYKKTLTDPKMLPFIMGTRKGFTVLDLSKTLALLKKVLFMVEEYISNQGQVILVCDNKVKPAKLKLLKKYFLVLENQWPEGSLTNFSNTRQKSTFNKEQNIFLDDNFNSTSLSKKINKKRKTQINRFFNKFQSLGFVSSYPRLVIYLGSSNNFSIFNELKSLNIPIVVLDDNLSSTTHIDYPILCNMKDPLFINFFLFLLISFAKKGKEKFFVKSKYRSLSNLKKNKLITLLNKNYGK